MSLISALTGITGIILMVAVSNDTATYTQMFSTYAISFILVGISVLFAFKAYENTIAYFALTFKDPYGYHRKVRAYTYAGRARAIRDYKNLGYTLYSEAEIKKEDLK